MENVKKRIMFIIGSFGGGGAERILVNLLRDLPREKFSSLVVVYKKEGALLELVPKDTPIFSLRPNLPRLLFPLIFILSIFRLASIIKREKPNLILPFLELSIFFAFFARKIAGIKVPFWAAERASPTAAFFAKEPMGFLKYIFYKFIIFFCYPRIDGILTVSFGLKKLLEENVPNIKKIEVIHNGCLIEEIEAKSKEEVGHYLFKGKRDYYLLCACGRIAWEKNYPLLIQGFAKLRKEGIKCKLLIIGKKNENSQEFKKVIKLIKNLEVEDDICFLGFESNPWNYVARCDLFILTSHYEGFPNVVVEAMICGTSIVAVDISGPNEIIEDKKSGILVKKDPDALKEAVKSLLLDEQKQKKLKEEGKNRARDFSLQAMVSKYVSFFSAYSS